MAVGKAFHLGLTQSMVHDVDLVLLPGDPQRVPKIAQFLKDSRTLAHQREFHSMLGQFEDKKVLITSTGIGGPSTAIAIEELAMLGLKRFIRIGTTGAIQDAINPGDLIIVTGAVRLDGASKHIAPIEYPAIASYRIVSALIQAAQQSKTPYHVGVVASSDTFYQGQSRSDSFLKGFVPKGIKDQFQELKMLNVLSFEMEAATVLTQTACYGLEAGCILGVLVNRNRKELPDENTIMVTEQKLIEVAVSSLTFLPSAEVEKT